MGDPSDPRTFTCDGSEPLLKEQPCSRCGLTDWYAFPERLDFRCGGCGHWYIDDDPKWQDLLNLAEPNR